MDVVRNWSREVAESLKRFSTTPGSPKLDLEWSVQGLNAARSGVALNQLARDLCDLTRELPEAVSPELLDRVPIGADGSFYLHLLRLEALARRLSSAPRWNSVLISRQPIVSIDTVVKIERPVLNSPETYASDFQTLLTHGYPWINLHAAGVFEHALLVEVEHASVGHHGSWSSVNLSGPSSRVCETAGWDLSDMLRIVS